MESTGGAGWYQGSGTYSLYDRYPLQGYHEYGDTFDPSSGHMEQGCGTEGLLEGDGAVHRGVAEARGDMLGFLFLILSPSLALGHLLGFPHI